jgi:hypothetical protein
MNMKIRELNKKDRQESDKMEAFTNSAACFTSEDKENEEIRGHLKQRRKKCLMKTEKKTKNNKQQSETSPLNPLERKSKKIHKRLRKRSACEDEHEKEQSDSPNADI